MSFIQKLARIKLMSFIQSFIQKLARIKAAHYELDPSEEIRKW